MTKYLVTGGCGFIGSHLVESIIDQGNAVCVLDDFSTGLKKNLPSQATLIEGSLTNRETVSEALEGVDFVFHLGAIASVQRSVVEWHWTHLVNQSATVALFEAIAEQRRQIPVVYASSAAVYGPPVKLPIEENDPKTPLSAYGVDKLGCELHAKVAWEVHNIPSIGFRLFNVYGPRQCPSSPYSGVISIFTDKIKKKLPLPVCGSGEQQRDFISVKDVTRFFLASCKQPIQGASVYNICRGEGVSINDLCSTFETLVGTKFERDYLKSRKGDIPISIGSPLLAEKTFGFKAATPLLEGLEELL